MTTVAVHPAASRLADSIAEVEMEIESLEDLESRQYVAWQHTAARLGDAVAELKRLREQQGALPFCDTCQNHHIPLSEPCPPPSGCVDCGAEGGEPCGPGCLSRNEIDYGETR